MANGFTIQIDGLQRLQKVMKRLPSSLKKEINAEFGAIGDEWKGAAQQDAPVNNSRLRASISKKREDLSVEIVAQAGHAGYMEFGTKSKARVPAELSSYASQFRGKGDNGGVSAIDALTKWVQRKGLNNMTYNVKSRKKSYKNKTEAAKAIAFLIFRKIKKYGVAPQPFLFTAKNGSNRLEFFTKKLKTNISNAIERALKV
jgi:hypothetical protein